MKSEFEWEDEALEMGRELDRLRMSLRMAKRDAEKWERYFTAVVTQVIASSPDEAVEIIAQIIERSDRDA